MSSHVKLNTVTSCHPDSHVKSLLLWRWVKNKCDIETPFINSYQMQSGNALKSFKCDQKLRKLFLIHHSRWRCLICKWMLVKTEQLAHIYRRREKTKIPFVACKQISAERAELAYSNVAKTRIERVLDWILLDPEYPVQIMYFLSSE